MFLVFTKVFTAQLKDILTRLKRSFSRDPPHLTINHSFPICELNFYVLWNFNIVFSSPSGSNPWVCAVPTFEALLCKIQILHESFRMIAWKESGRSFSKKRHWKSCLNRITYEMMGIVVEPIAFGCDQCFLSGRRHTGGQIISFGTFLQILLM